MLAHRSRLSDYPKEIKTEEWAYLFTDWPVTYRRTVRNAHRYLGRLINSNEVLDHIAPNRRSYVAQQVAPADAKKRRSRAFTLCNKEQP